MVISALGYTPLSNATSFRTVNSVSVVGSGDISIPPFPGFGTSHVNAAYGDHLHTGVYEPAFSKNSAFNKNFGTSTGQVWGYDAHPTTIDGYGILNALSTSATIGSTNTLGRVYNGTSSQTTPTSILGVYSDGYVYNFNSAALQSWLGLGSSAYASTSSFIQNQNSSAQSANMWISGSGKFQSATNQYGSLNGTQLSFSRPSDGAATVYFLKDTSLGANQGTANIWGYDGIKFKTTGGETTVLTIESSGAATFASTINATQLQSTIATSIAPLTVNSATMVSNLNTQYLNGYQLNNFVYGSNLIGTIASNGIDINGINPRASFYTGYNNTNTPNSNTADYGYINIPLWSGVSSGDKTSLQIGGTYGYGTARIRNINSSGVGTWYDIYHSGNLTNNLSTNYIPKWNGSALANSKISEISGGISIDGYGTATGFKTSRNSSSYLLATDGSDIDVNLIGGVSQVQQTINGSGSGIIVCSEPFRYNTYKKVIIYLQTLNGSAGYTFPVQFTYTPIVSTNNVPISYTVSETSINISASFISG